MDATDVNVMVQNVAPALRNSAVTDIVVQFSSPINQPTFTTADLSLTLNGGSGHHQRRDHHEHRRRHL